MATKNAINSIDLLFLHAGSACEEFGMKKNESTTLSSKFRDKARETIQFTQIQ